MTQSTSIKLFEDKNIRTLWDEDQEQWYFSVVDVIAVLTDSTNPRHYWIVLKGRLKEEGNQSVTNCDQLKFQAADGKYYLQMRRLLNNYCALFNQSQVRKQNRLSCDWRGLVLKD